MSLILQKFYKTLLYKSLLVALMLLFSFSLSQPSSVTFVTVILSYRHTWYVLTHGAWLTIYTTKNMQNAKVPYHVCHLLSTVHRQQQQTNRCWVLHTKASLGKAKNQTLYPEDYNVLRLERNDPDKMWHVQLVAVSTSLGCSSCQKSSKLWREAVHQRNLCQ